MWRIRISNKYRSSRVRTLHYTRVEWNLAQEWQVVFFTHFLSTAFSENEMVGIAVLTLEVAHVFYNSNNWNIEFLEHAKCFYCHVTCNLLRSGNNYNSRDWN